MTMVSSRVVTIPNLLSLLRLLLIPVFIVLMVTEQYGYAVLTLAVSSITDFADGYIARRFGQVTRLGQLLDPAADRLYILTTLLGITIAGIVPWWFPLVIIAREALLIGLGLVLARHGYGPLPVHSLGKMGTFCLLLGFPVVLLAAAFPAAAPIAAPIGWAALIWGAYLYWWAGFAYARETVRVVRLARVPQEAGSDTLDS
ncbi:CDP-alcohol phosphatidyltransferase family protein [Homoserinibacter sp. YIM 151385]|uniref:CDP-alcohol phosphatidyltransferase family protein n=1 Tax=Homoserinibacter sp. YIM 151385 TaxID=2985506 RepID=UPI0022F03E2A|nr:CDP-alcohol phosphatidyltransferase family protein [Homoserinibacter sp. YIM 151385]WBU38763.1 CDP-alcohol phosphatidyltransferase family protein [Homoserinibacter sp. YIM 151385]